MQINVTTIREMEREACPAGLSQLECRSQVVERIAAARLFFGEEVVDRLLCGGDVLWSSFDTGIDEDGALADLKISFSGGRYGHGDFVLGIWAEPYRGEKENLLRLARVGFSLREDAVDISLLQGQSSASDVRAVRAFGFETVNKPWFRILQKSLADIKPFNALIGVIMHVALGKGIGVVQSYNPRHLPHSAISTIKHGMRSALFATGHREVGDESGFFSVDVSHDTIGNNFRRITGAPGNNGPRKKQFDRLLSHLALSFPFLFSRSADADFSLHLAHVKKLIANLDL